MAATDMPPATLIFCLARFLRPKWANSRHSCSRQEVTCADADPILTPTLPLDPESLSKPYPNPTPKTIPNPEYAQQTQVTAFSRWERELPKLMGDPRFSAVASTKDRRALFDEFCKDVGAAARTGSKAATAKGAARGWSALQCHPADAACDQTP